MCTQCSNTSLLFGVTNSCKKMTAIDNCQTQTSSTVCDSCNSGFALSSLKTCVSSATDTNCLEVDAGDKCIRCCGTKLLWPVTSSCVDPFDYQTENCRAYTKITEDSLVCSYCAANAYVQLIADEAVCLQNDTKLLPDVTIHCIEVSLSSNTIVCTECETGYYLNFLDSTCVAQCAYTIVLVSLTFSGNRVKKNRKLLCKDVLLPNCLVASQRFDVPTEAYVCV